jgi:translation elongation factor P/translation initiation factor 5A
MNKFKFNDNPDNFETKIVNDLIIGDIVMIKNNICKITDKIYSHQDFSPKSKFGQPNILIKCVGVFDDNERFDIFPYKYNIQLPKINIKTILFVSISDKIIQLYDENLNIIIHIQINYILDDVIIKKILNFDTDTNTDTNIEIKVKIIEFGNLIRIIDIE